MRTELLGVFVYLIRKSFKVCSITLCGVVTLTFYAIRIVTVSFSVANDSYSRVIDGWGEAMLLDTLQDFDRKRFHNVAERLKES